MKRYPKPREPYAFKIHPKLHWIKCNFCDCEFKNEDGWKAYDDFDNRFLTVFHSCNTCCKSEEELLKKIRPFAKPPKKD